MRSGATPCSTQRRRAVKSSSRPVAGCGNGTLSVLAAAPVAGSIEPEREKVESWARPGIMKSRLKRCSLSMPPISLAVRTK